MWKMKTEATVTSDCQWVVDQCKRRLKERDKYGAKAWIITARSLYPKDFRVQWEVFNMHHFCKELTEAAKTLAEICGNFSAEEQLKHYLEGMVSCVCGLQSEEEGEEGEEKEKIFQKLPSDVQRDVLQNCAAQFDDTLKKCRILVEVMKRFPETIVKVGIEALDLLSKKFYDSPPSPTHVQPAHELLVYDVIPLLVSSSNVLAEGTVSKAEQGKVLFKMGYFCQWLEIVANFYAAATSRSALRGEIGPLLHDSKTVWDVLHEILQSVAAKCMWKEVMRSKVVGPKLSPRQRWGFFEKFPKGRDLAIAPFYVAVLLFFQMLWEYYAAVKGLDDDSGQSWVMVARESNRSQLQEHSEERPPKRRKIETEAVVKFNTGVSHIDQYACERFHIAANCWDFLTSDPTYREEFSRLYRVWGAMDWIWFKKFEVDLAISKGDFTQAATLLNQWKDRLVSGGDREEDSSKQALLDVLLQLVSVHLCQGDVTAAAAQVKQLMLCLPEESSCSKDSPCGKDAVDTRGNQTEGSGHHVTLLPCQPSDILDFIVQFAIKGLKEVLANQPDNDTVIGQLIILLQYGGPEANELLWQLFQTIQKKRSFVCTSLLQYVTDIRILEEISFLANSDAMEHVRVVPESESETLRRRTVTRGVNREKQDELSEAVQEQVKRWSEPPRVVVRAFLSQEQLAL